MSVSPVRGWNMPDPSESPKSTGPDNEPPRYNAIILDRAGMTLGYVAVPATTDEDATGQVVSMLDGHAIDLWDGPRFIAHFPPIDTPK